MKSLVTEDIVLTGMGLNTCIGNSPQLVGAALHANIQRITTHPRYRWLGCPSDVDDDTANISICAVPTIDNFEDGQQRLIELAKPAFKSLLKDSGLSEKNSLKSAVLLALPEPDKVISTWPFDQNFVVDVLTQSGVKMPTYLNFNQFGATGSFSCLGEACQLLKESKVDYCIVGGLDSYLLEERLENLDKQWRAKSPRNVDGFTPGEAGIMLMFERLESALSRGAKIYCTVEALGLGVENNSFHSQKSSTALGLSDAIRGVMAARNLSDTHVFDYVYCDLNGESYAAEEWGLVKSRLGVQFDETKRLIHHAASCGDLGAATGAMLLASAGASLAFGYQKYDESLLWASADSGQRFASLLAKY